MRCRLSTVSVTKEQTLLWISSSLESTRFRRRAEKTFFYQQLTKTDPDSTLVLTPYINDMRQMNEVHWESSRRWSIHFAVIKGDSSLVRALLARGSFLSSYTGDKYFIMDGRLFFRSKLSCVHVAALHGHIEILECILGASNLPIDY